MSSNESRRPGGAARPADGGAALADRVANPFPGMALEELSRQLYLAACRFDDAHNELGRQPGGDELAKAETEETDARTLLLGVTRQLREAMKGHPAAREAARRVPR